VGIGLGVELRVLGAKGGLLGKGPQITLPHMAISIGKPCGQGWQGAIEASASAEATLGISGGVIIGGGYEGTAIASAKCGFAVDRVGIRIVLSAEVAVYREWMVNLGVFQYSRRTFVTEKQASWEPYLVEWSTAAQKLNKPLDPLFAQL